MVIIDNIRKRLKGCLYDDGQGCYGELNNDEIIVIVPRGIKVVVKQK